MHSIYGEISNQMIHANTNDLVGQIFKLLPYKEENDDRLDYHFTTLLFRIGGMSKVFNGCPELITVISLLENARHESDFSLYRKAVLDSCSIIKSIQDQLNE